MRIKSSFSSRATRVLALALAVCAIAPAGASAGTLFKSQSCVPAGSNAAGCTLLASFYNQFNYAAVNTYCRFGMVDQNSWYPSHRVQLIAASGSGNGYFQGAWTSSRFAYSPIAPADMGGTCATQLNTTTSLGKAYNNQLYIGTY